MCQLQFAPGSVAWQIQRFAPSSLSRNVSFTLSAPPVQEAASVMADSPVTSEARKTEAKISAGTHTFAEVYGLLADKSVKVSKLLPSDGHQAVSTYFGHPILLSACGAPGVSALTLICPQMLKWGLLPDGSKGPSTLEEAVDALAGHALNQVPSAPTLLCCGAKRKHSYTYSYSRLCPVASASIYSLYWTVKKAIEQLQWPVLNTLYDICSMLCSGAKIWQPCRRTKSPQ